MAGKIYPLFFNQHFPEKAWRNFNSRKILRASVVVSALLILNLF